MPKTHDGKSSRPWSKKGLVAAAAVGGLADGLARRRGAVSRPVFARWYGLLSRRAERGELGERRRALLRQASGRVLDLGAGTGESFEHFPSTVGGVVAMDPDRAMTRQAQRRLHSAGIPVWLVRAVGERLPFPAGSFDTAVATLVLCTVAEPETTTAELHRVLRPGGQLLFMEHVRASEEELAHWQDRLARPWSWMNGGCHPNRRTLEIVQSAGFRLTAVQAYGFPILPHVQGTAVRA
ncbi:MAG: class I SAM-dependent methyltransferase [Actinomycetota bacterium]|nr:class I SAM-dependent methyltransferase [Actinomycetota bacterium]